MSEKAPGNVNSTVCPGCGKPMAHVRTIWRAFKDNLDVWECRACAVSVTQTAKTTQSERT